MSATGLGIGVQDGVSCFGGQAGSLQGPQPPVEALGGIHERVAIDIAMQGAAELFPVLMPVQESYIRHKHPQLGLANEGHGGWEGLDRVPAPQVRLALIKREAMRGENVPDQVVCCLGLLRGHNNHNVVQVSEQLGPRIKSPDA
jgi:hypothetical protein